MSVKININKEIIIKTAFQEWGKNGFKNPSLKIISDKLKLTKPALYRHFKNKDELLKDMKKYFLKEFYIISENFINESKNSTDVFFTIKSYINNYFNFFSKNHYYFFFFIFYIVMDKYFNKMMKFEKLEKENEIFVNVIKTKNSNWATKDNIELLKRLIFSTGIFMLIFKFNKNKTKIYKSFNELESNNIVNDICDIIFNGFGTEKIKIDIDFNKVEKDSTVFEIDIPEREKIIDAVTEVIAEEGIWNTSLSKISKKMGIAKSSLYFYFKDKNEMLTNTIKNELIKNDNVIRSKIFQTDFFEENLYSFIVISSSFLILDTKFRKMFDWLYYQGFKLNSIKKLENIKLFDRNLIKEGIKNNYLKSNKYKYDSSFISAYLKIQIIKEIYYSELLGRDFNKMNIRTIFKLFLKGMKEVIK